MGYGLVLPFKSLKQESTTPPPWTIQLANIGRKVMSFNTTNTVRKLKTSDFHRRAVQLPKTLCMMKSSRLN